MAKSRDKKTQQQSDGQDVSLEQMSNAFAEMMGEASADEGDATGPESPDDSAEPAEATAESPALPSAEDDSVCPVTPKSILEAMLFVGHPENEPLSRAQVASIIRGVDEGEVNDLVDQLNADYAEGGYALEIASQGAGYRLALRPDMQRIRERFYGKVRQSRLSQAAIEVLALVAYNQPMTSEKVSNARGRPSGALLSQLVRRQLLSMERRKEKPRTPVYTTTARFLDLFGLESLEELPQSQDLES